MTVRAKFRVTAVTEHEGGNKGIHLVPVIDGSPENKTFWKYTPSGEIDLSINAGTEAYHFFQPGNEVYVDFTLAAGVLPATHPALLGKPAALNVDAPQV